MIKLEYQTSTAKKKPQKQEKIKHNVTGEMKEKQIKENSGKRNNVHIFYVPMKKIEMNNYIIICFVSDWETKQ